MYALDNVYVASRTQFDISDIPAHIIALYSCYAEARALTSDYYPERSTAAQKRTATMRFNKFYDAVEAAGLDVSNVLVRLTNV